MKTSFKEGQRISGIIVVVYAAVTNSDPDEGLGHKVDDSYYCTNREAFLAASGIGVMGRDGSVEARKALVLDDESVILLNSCKEIEIKKFPIEKEEALRESARKKLTPAEYRVLTEIL